MQHIYGVKPIHTEEAYIEAEENDMLKELEYESIRFALKSETASPLYDTDYERFVRYIMKGGKKALAYELAEKTFFYVKMYQIKKLKKQQARKEGLERDKEAGKEQSAIDSLNASDEEEIETNPMTILQRALKNCEPVVITKKVKRGGATYQVPYPLGAKQREWFAIRWLLEAVRERPKPREKQFPQVMAQELIDAAYLRGMVIKRRDDMHRLADANKAYAHYRWG